MDQLGFQCHQEKPDAELKHQVMQNMSHFFLLSVIKEEILFWGCEEGWLALILRTSKIDFIVQKCSR